MKKIYSSRDWRDYIDEAKDYVGEYDVDENDEDYEDFINGLAEQCCRADMDAFFLPILERYFDEHKCLVSGSIGRWDGPSHGYDVIESSRDFYRLIKGDLDIEIFEEPNCLVICGYHHDGEDLFYIRELTDAGIAWYEKYPDGVGVRGLEDDRLSKAPSIDWFL